MPENAPKLTDAEWLIMNALWQDHPATARQLADRLPESTSWAYTTIKTLLARLTEKGAVAERKQGHTSLYEPLLSRSKARRHALVNLANQAFDGAFGSLLHFLIDQQDLSPRQRDELLRELQKSAEPDQKP